MRLIVLSHGYDLKIASHITNLRHWQATQINIPAYKIYHSWWFQIRCPPYQSHCHLHSKLNYFQI